MNISCRLLFACTRRAGDFVLWCNSYLNFNFSCLLSSPRLINFSFINIFFLFHFHSISFCRLISFEFLFACSIFFVISRLQRWSPLTHFFASKNDEEFFSSKLNCRVKFSVIFVSSPWNYFSIFTNGGRIFFLFAISQFCYKTSASFSQVSSKSLILLLITQHSNISRFIFLSPKCTKL